jgi:hypothetical protein
MLFQLADETPGDSQELVSANSTSLLIDSTTSDRFWLIDTRSLSAQACRAQLDPPRFSMFRVECNGRSSLTTFDQYIESVRSGRDVVIYVHGNRLEADEAIQRGLAVHRRIGCFRGSGPIDWVIFSWPSAKQGTPVRDARIKAERTDAQGLYLSWVLQKHAEFHVPTALIGYSFGGRIVTGALHALAGGRLGGRSLPGPAVTGIPFEAGLVAPAIESNSMASGGEYALATQNLNRLFLLYNRRDAVLKRYWLIERVRGTMALGYSGPQAFSPRVDGTRLPVQARDCSPSIGLRHDELDYYETPCHAGSDMAAMIHDIQHSN